MRMLTIASILGVLVFSTSANSETTIQGCPMDIAVQQVDRFVVKKNAELAEQVSQLVNEMDAINSKATKPGVSIGEQLSASDRNRFTQLSQTMGIVSALQWKLSDFQRDVHVILETLAVAQLVDRYELKKEEIGAASPRYFYFTILEGLRHAAPRVSKTALIKGRVDCDLERGLFFEEEFNQQQLAKNGADQRTLNLILDIERLRILYQLCWNIFDKGTNDVANTKWSGASPVSPNTMDAWVRTAGRAVEEMFANVIPYIDKQLPSEQAIGTAFMQKEKQNAGRDYPTIK